MASSENSAHVTDFDPVAKSFSELDKLIQSAGKGRMLGLEPISLRPPVAEPVIHAFYTMVSWLYVCVIECGPVHFRFLAERAAALGIDPAKDLKTFRDDMQVFRTVLQHNLNLADADDLAKLVRCESWMAMTLGRQILPGDRFWPSHESEWRKLAEELRERAARFAEMNLATLKRLVEDEYAEDAIQEWVVRCNRSLAGHEFDAIAAKVAGDLGLQHLDVTRLRNVHSPEWNRHLRLLPYGADARLEARRLVEQTLLSEADNYLPITGDDVIDFLGVKPGPKVGKLLRRARELYPSEPCSREDLLERLKTGRPTTGSA